MAPLQPAPDIPEAIVFLPPTCRGRGPVTEPDLRPIAAVAAWGPAADVGGAASVVVVSRTTRAIVCIPVTRCLCKSLTLYDPTERARMERLNAYFTETRKGLLS